MLALISIAAATQCPAPLTAALLHQRVALALQAPPEEAAAVLDTVSCLSEWAEPALAADVLALGAHIGRVGEGWARTTTLPDLGRCLWRADGVPLVGGVWAQPDGPALLQRRCADDALTTWYLPDAILPDEALVAGAFSPAEPVGVVLTLPPPRQPVAVRRSMSSSQARRQTFGLASLSVSAVSLSFAVATRAWYRGGLYDADTLKSLNIAFGTAGYVSGAIGAGTLMLLERERHREAVPVLTD